MAERRSLATRALYLAEGMAANLAFGIMRLFGIETASAIGGFLARSIGPHLGISRSAERNLQRAMPELDDAARRRIVRGMWDNLGRVAAEYPHIGEIEAFTPNGRVEVSGLEEVIADRGSNRRYIFVSAHYGNWEIGLLTCSRAGLKTVGIYRAPNNPVIGRLLDRARRWPLIEMIPKGSAAARQLLLALRDGSQLCILPDQKMNDGIAVPFFGRPAMTAPALARLALRFDCIVLPVRVERLPKARFRVVADPPIAYERTGDAQRDTLALMTKVNETLERWIREKPDHWFWVHRRWPD